MKRICRFGCTSALFVAMGLAAASSSASGQDIRPAANPREDVVVVAPYFLHKKLLMGTSDRMPVYSFTVEQKVYYADLDLATQWGATELQKRVNDAARDACAELDRTYPRAVYAPLSDTGHCVQIASKDGQARAQEVIAAYPQ